MSASESAGTITQIKQQVKNPERVSIFVDGKYSFSLTLDQVLIEKIAKGNVLSDERIHSLRKLSEEGKLRARTLEWLLNRPHSERELREYLYRKKADKDFAQQLVEEFKQKNYLNDKVFARWFADARLRKQKSVRELRYELCAKGVADEDIAEVLAELTTADTDDESLARLVQKLQGRSRYQDEQKLKRYLVSKGFSYDAIRRVLAK